MRQSIEKQQETMGGQKVVTVMFHDSRQIPAHAEPFRAREVVVPSLSAPLKDFSVVAVSSSLSRNLNANDLHEFTHHRTRRRTSPHIEKFSAEEPMAFSALAVSAVNPNKRGTQAAIYQTTTMTEQRCCAAA
jgi:hypothetical protein